MTPLKRRDSVPKFVDHAQPTLDLGKSSLVDGGQKPAASVIDNRPPAIVPIGNYRYRSAGAAFSKIKKLLRDNPAQVDTIDDRFHETSVDGTMSFLADSSFWLVETRIAAMGGWRRAVELALSDEDIAELTAISRSRTERGSRVARARMLLAYRGNPSFFAVGRAVGVHHQTVERCIERAVAYGPLSALDDRPRPGREPTITPEAKAWLVSLACDKAKDHGYPHELWTTRLLADHARNGGRRQDIDAWLIWSRARYARSSVRRKSSRTRSATILRTVTPTSNGKWPRFCASIVKSKC